MLKTYDKYTGLPVMKSKLSKEDKELNEWVQVYTKYKDTKEEITKLKKLYPNSY